MGSIFDSPKFRPMDRVAGKITISITGTGVGFSKQVLSRLGYAHYVQIFINEEDKLLGIKACEQDTPNSMKFISQKKEKVDSLRWNNPTFKTEIQSLVSKELSKANYACDGEYLPEEKAVLFDFNKAYPMKKEQ